MNIKDKKLLENLISKYSKKNLSKKIIYPLIDEAFSSVDICKGIEVLLSGQLTMSEITREFEYELLNILEPNMH